MFLDPNDFSKLVELSPLIAIDLIIEVDNGVLLGKRKNRPAKDYWFVPGGRIFKNETLDDAVLRISLEEISAELSRHDLEFYGVFEHFYSDSYVSDSVSTHYVVLAYKVKLESSPQDLPVAQHAEYKIFSMDEILKNNLVHKYTKQYFYSKGVK